MRIVRGLAILFVSLGSRVVLGQTVSAGTLTPVTSDFPSGVQTVMNLGYGAASDGLLRSATFRWSTAPCSAAVKIKFYRLHQAFHLWTYELLGERGPFDVHGAVETVALEPPVAVAAGDLVGIAGVTGCGSPVAGDARLGSGYRVLVDDTSGFTFGPLPPGGNSPPPLVHVSDLEASPPSTTLSLLGGRFAVTLTATDPRTGRITDGQAIASGDRNGAFSLPDFTGDPLFPEVLVKMADATSEPSLGGMFWVFHAPLTDVAYTLTVRDRFTNRTRVYTNASSAPGQLCGGVDTSAFPP